MLHVLIYRFRSVAVFSRIYSPILHLMRLGEGSLEAHCKLQGRVFWARHGNQGFMYTVALDWNDAEVQISQGMSKQYLS